MGKETCACLSSFHLIITIFQHPNATAVILYIPDEVERLEFRTRRLRVSLLVIGHVYEAGGGERRVEGKENTGKCFLDFSLLLWRNGVHRFEYTR